MKNKKQDNCKHYWRVGSYIGYFIGKQLRKKGINIWCEKCGKKIYAYYKPSFVGKRNFISKKGWGKPYGY